MKNFDKLKEMWTEKDLLPDNDFEVSFSTQICRIIRKMRKENCCENANACKECYKWLQQEYKEPILDDVERKYLSAVIMPFRNAVRFIYKSHATSIRTKKEYIFINLEDDYTSLPYFTAGTMYKGMKLNKRYTLEELGL